jgi:hypothetical protein
MTLASGVSRPFRRARRDHGVSRGAAHYHASGEKGHLKAILCRPSGQPTIPPRTLKPTGEAQDSLPSQPATKPGTWIPVWQRQLPRSTRDHIKSTLKAILASCLFLTS